MHPLIHQPTILTGLLRLFNNYLFIIIYDLNLPYIVRTYEWVVVNQVVESSRSKCESSDDLSRFDRFLGVGDGSAVDQVNYSVGHHFGVDTEVPPTVQVRQSAVWN